MEKRLFKYVDIKGAEAILKDGTLLFSSPIYFNDPFDISIQTLFGYDPFDLEAHLDEFINLKKSDHSVETRGKKNIYNLSSLRVYELVKQVFSEKLTDSKINERFKNHIYSVIENIGSGYYSYNQEVKIISYVEARKKLGALLALIQSNEQQKNEWQKEILTIEVDVLSALGALTRKLEKKVSHAKN